MHMSAKELERLAGGNTDYTPQGGRRRSHSTHENDGTLLAPLLQSVQPLFPMSTSSENGDEHLEDTASKQLHQMEAGVHYADQDDSHRSSNSLDSH